ncbi:MAG: growth inhibitor PemK [Halothiobacillus sp. 24-54-40]|jgi:mRNA interferase MazF|nr:MAG: growth inhibitor PemK [Halothiobacillus sp. 35-54-62]OYY57203.1 MAG: growth inhibitor PemK [Halothiobacillus sp. 28-55-5]OYZ85250.1 MAG: growth inhibitor PemK [Halothiobacillus sp. 24-54-40]OZA78943.1 MAG: growth inhibitor PemK [Halothiobacillus sp. 39-53-45]HQS02349.1 type II toxin-antitoxin system PemK/MazF family toxin [Halothiobacillus sp.]
MKRGDLLGIVLQGDFGKPRPALIIQSDQFDTLGTLTVLLLTSTLIDAPLLRVTLTPNAQNGLQKVSQVMIDKAMTIRRDKLGTVFGTLGSEHLLQINRSLAVFLGIV